VTGSSFAPLTPRISNFSRFTKAFGRKESNMKNHVQMIVSAFTTVMFISRRKGMTV
jgi:hypothetical protein